MIKKTFSWCNNDLDNLFGDAIEHIYLNWNKGKCYGKQTDSFIVQGSKYYLQNLVKSKGKNAFENSTIDINDKSQKEIKCLESKNYSDEENSRLIKEVERILYQFAAKNYSERLFLDPTCSFTGNEKIELFIIASMERGYAYSDIRKVFNNKKFMEQIHQFAPNYRFPKKSNTMYQKKKRLPDKIAKEVRKFSEEDKTINPSFIGEIEELLKDKDEDTKTEIYKEVNYNLDEQPSSNKYYLNS